MSNRLDKITTTLAEKILSSGLSKAQKAALIEGLREAKVFAANDGPTMELYAEFPWSTRRDTRAAIAEKLGSEVVCWVPRRHQSHRGPLDPQGRYEWGTMVQELAWAKFEAKN